MRPTKNLRMRNHKGARQIGGKMGNQAKKMRYLQKFNYKWTNEEKLKGWLAPSNVSPHYAFCRACKLHLAFSTGGKHDLLRHNKSKKHLAKVKNLPNGLPIENDPQDTIMDDFIDEKSFKIRQVNNCPPLCQMEIIDGSQLEEGNPEVAMNNEIEGPKGINTPSGSSTATIKRIIVSSSGSDPHAYTTQQRVEDDNDVFGRHVANELRNLKDEAKKRWARFSIQKVLFEAYFPSEGESQSTVE